MRRAWTGRRHKWKADPEHKERRVCTVCGLVENIGIGVTRYYGPRWETGKPGFLSRTMPGCPPWVLNMGGQE